MLKVKCSITINVFFIGNVYRHMMRLAILYIAAHSTFKKWSTLMFFRKNHHIHHQMG